MSLPADTFLWKFGKSWVVPFIQKRYCIEYRGEVPQPPYLLICNHVSAIDPFFVAPYIHAPISWVVAQISFQNSFERFLLKKIGAIQKFKSRPDPAMLHTTLNILDKGGIVGLFPEGTITWTGEFQDHLLSERGMERLILALNTPIVAARIQGAWLSHPVWAVKTRKPQVFINFKTFSDPSAIDFIRHSEWEWQKSRHIHYPGKGKAFGIERVLWMCPQCSNFRTLTGQGDTIICSLCQNHWTIDDYGYIDGQPLPDLFARQIHIFSQWLHNPPLITIPQVKLTLRDARTTRLMKTINHQLIIQNDVFICGDVNLEIMKMKGMNTHFRDILEFRYDNTMVRIKTTYSSFLLYNWIIIRKKILDESQKIQNIV